MNRRLRQIAQLLARGLSNKEIAAALGITEGTTKVYTHRLYALLEISPHARNTRVVAALQIARQAYQ